MEMQKVKLLLGVLGLFASTSGFAFEGFGDHAPAATPATPASEDFVAYAQADRASACLDDVERQCARMGRDLVRGYWEKLGWCSGTCRAAR